ncbi:MAG: DNA primase [delta proteobacterium ML8_F1]|nr:MAG: DNA primase [delta proteobacterium ML8_F1]
MKERINEIIVVEGRDDQINLKKYVEAEIIVTHGFGIREETIRRIQLAAQKKGIIIFTDPDFAGEAIRKRINQMVKGAKHAFISAEEATRGNDIGIENASGEAILKALKKVRTFGEIQEPLFSRTDLIQAGLVGEADAACRRDRLGHYLGIGYTNGKQFLYRLNHYGITREEFQRGLEELEKSI